MRKCLVATLVVLIIPILATQAEGGTSLAITHATFDAESGSMTLSGTNFESFGVLEIWIGDVCLTSSTPPSCTVAPETIVCDLSATPAASTGGTWKVWVSACNAPHCKDEIHLAIATSTTACNSGDFVECYTGPAGTAGVGECVSGVRSCIGGEWGLCTGEFVPVNELCGDGLDNDCDGLVDLQDTDCCLDDDGDGYGTGPYCLGLDCDDSDPEIPGAQCDGPDSDVCAEGYWECVGDIAQCTDNTANSIETCNGIDDDCNGGTDDEPGLCDDGLSCTFDTCGSGQCVHDLAPNACFIEGVCYGQGQPNPESGCLVCSPSFSQFTWRLVSGTCLVDGLCYSNGQEDPANACQYCDSSVNPYDWRPRNCNDNNNCTIDACDPIDGCVFTPISCDDGIACTADHCDSTTGSCRHESLCNGSTTFQCPPTSIFTSPWMCSSDDYCNFTTGQCEAESCCY